MVDLENIKNDFEIIKNSNIQDEITESSFIKSSTYQVSVNVNQNSENLSMISQKKNPQSKKPTMPIVKKENSSNISVKRNIR